MAWVSPTGHDDYDTVWGNETNAYDEDTETYASTLSETGYLGLTLTGAISCDKVRIFAADEWAVPVNPEVDIDVYYDSAWNNIFSGEITKGEWVEKTISAGTKSVDKARVRSTLTGNEHRIFEFDFNQTGPITYERSATVPTGVTASAKRQCVFFRSTWKT